MNLRTLSVALAFLGVALLGACGAESPPAGGGSAAAPATPGSALLLPQDPPDAVPILEALGGAEGQEVAVVGRLQSKVKGRALFHLVDDSVLDCTRCGSMDDCKTPWDYCCNVKGMKAASLLVELRGPDGQPTRVEPLGLRELDLVVVRGTLAKGEGGRLMLLAKDGWFVREHPKLSSRLRFPD